MNKLIIFLLFIIKTSLVQAIETPAKQGILYDYETKTVLFEKNSDELMSPSSMSKIMTIYYLFKKIKDGEISIDDEFEVSKKAWKKGGSKMFVNLKGQLLFYIYHEEVHVLKENILQLNQYSYS